MTSMEGIVSVFPSRTQELLTTRLWDFLGFPQTIVVSALFLVSAISWDDHKIMAVSAISRRGCCCPSGPSASIVGLLTSSSSGREKP